MTFRHFSVGAALLIFFSTAFSLKAQTVDGIAAVVNQDIITFTDVQNTIGRDEELLQKTFGRDPNLPERLRQGRLDALEQLIARRLIIQQFNETGGKNPENVKLLDRLVQEDIERDIQEQYGRDRSVFIKTLEGLGMNLENYKQKIREKIIVQIMNNHEVSNEIIISPFKIEKYYNEHAEEFKEGEKVKLKMIYIKKGANAQENEGARSIAQELLIKLASGSDFASMALVYSDSSEKNQGGDLGFVGKETLREELRDVAFALAPGQVSRVVETKDGFYILMVEEKKPAKTTTMEEARDWIEDHLIKAERKRLMDRWIATLKRKAYIRRY